MRGLRSTIALFVVLIALGGYIYYLSSKKTDDSATKQDNLFGTLDAASLSDLTVKSESGEVTTLKKDNGTWKIVSPFAVPASESDVNNIGSALSNLNVVRVVDENPTDLKDYGLDHPKMEVDFKTADGKTSGKLLLGEKTATGANLYARRDDQKRVVLVGQYNEATFNKSMFDLRDKTIIKIDRAKIDGADINVGGKAAEFAKADGDWSMTKPVPARADFSAVEGLVGHIESLQMKSIASAQPTPADLKTYGLDKPDTTVSLHLGGSARATVMVGGKAPDGSVYVRDAARPDVFTVDATAADDLKKAADDYRKKELFDFRAFNATHVELTHNGQTLVLERVKAQKEGDPDSWHRVSPNPGDPDRSKVENFLAGLADIRATSFVDPKTKTGLDAPVLTVFAKFDEGKKEERVKFGKVGSDAFASRPDDPPAAKVEAEKVDDAVKAFDELSK